MSHYKIDIGAISDKGIVKESNQDNILVQIGEHNHHEFGLFVVCDGLGGLAFGEVASATAVKIFKKWWETKVAAFVKNTNDDEIISSLRQAVLAANEEILDYSKKINQRVGTTISALLIIKSKYYIVHVGDSRIYSVSTNIEQLTEDHSFVAMQVKNGQLTKEEAKRSSQKNLLLQCLGVKQGIQVYTKVGRVKDDEMFIVCSDGFYNSFEDWELLRKLRVWKFTPKITLQEQTGILVDLVKERKERDNISAIIISIDKQEQSIFNNIFG